jgi:hypothetical protein
VVKRQHENTKVVKRHKKRTKERNENDIASLMWNIQHNNNCHHHQMKHIRRKSSNGIYGNPRPPLCYRRIHKIHMFRVFLEGFYLCSILRKSSCRIGRLYNLYSSIVDICRILCRPVLGKYHNNVVNYLGSFATAYL